MSKKTFLYTALFLLLIILYLLGNQVKSVIITSDIFFETKAYLALVFSLVSVWLYLKTVSKEKLVHQYYRQPGRFIAQHIFTFIALWLLVYVFAKPTLQILTKYTASKNYQDIFHFTVNDQTKTSAGFDLFHCDNLLIKVEEMHEHASFCLSSEIEAPDKQQIIGNQSSHRIRIKGSRTGYGILVSTLELVELTPTQTIKD